MDLLQVSQKGKLTTMTHWQTCNLGELRERISLGKIQHLEPGNQHVPPKNNHPRSICYPSEWKGLFYAVRAAHYQRSLFGRSTGSVYAGGTGVLAPFQEGTGRFISCSFGSCRWHLSSITWFSSTDMKTLETKHTYSINLISIAQLGLVAVYLLPGTDINSHRAPHQAKN